MLPYLDNIVKKIKSIIIKQKDKLYVAAIACVRMLAMSVGAALNDYMKDIIGKLLSLLAEAFDLSLQQRPWAFGKDPAASSLYYLVP